jgi:ABC-2 type transport system ATP-binding protein
LFKQNSVSTLRIAEKIHQRQALSRLRKSLQRTPQAWQNGAGAPVAGDARGVTGDALGRIAHTAHPDGDHNRPAVSQRLVKMAANRRQVMAFERLSKKYGAFTTVHDLDLAIEQGEVFGFLGPNGAGKTTTIHMMMGILVPTSGRVVIEGLDCQRDRVAVKRQVGYLPDNPMFYDYLRGREILEFVGEMHGLSRGEARERAGELLEEFALADASEEFAVNYSTGMKKKLGLACALIHDPSVLILDEPTNGLDPRAALDVQERLRRSAAQGKTIFLSTHLLDMAQRLCDRVGIIDNSVLVAVGPVRELQERVVPGTMRPFSGSSGT